MPRRSPSLLLVHAVWATYDRKPYLPPSLDPHLQTMVGRHAQEVGCQLMNHPRRFTQHFAWQRGDWAESLSPGDLNPTIDYVTRQRQHHDAAHPAERWAMAPSFSGNLR